MAALTVTDEELQAAIRYMKAEDIVEENPTEKDDIKSLYLAAMIYLSGGGVEKPKENPELYYLAVHGLTLHYYDHRDAIGDPDAIPKGTRNIINQLKRNGEISEIVSNLRN